MQGIKFDITVTLSKILAYITIPLGAAVSIIIGDASPFLGAITAGSAMVVNKQYQDRLKYEISNDKPES